MGDIRGLIVGEYREMALANWPRMPIVPKGLEYLFSFPRHPATMEEWVNHCTYAPRYDLYSRRTGLQFSNDAALTLFGQENL